eukprot:CAMPEP_0185830202 /NCGR_PEP_ID=MMETSP1353-20130828/683_1 /TAXON_ID=1077150 /ORGANISM="Erythrolobus australicus, Strain CCMP3124" /LENGTH=723 /DNA_ID=CAMNT_0028528067 /DNA_START=21 /DNA_END=2191 /DNA_ORIENTATION=+
MVCAVCDAQQIETNDAEQLTAEELGRGIASHFRVNVSQMLLSQHLSQQPPDASEHLEHRMGAPAVPVETKLAAMTSYPHVASGDARGAVAHWNALTQPEDDPRLGALGMSKRRGFICARLSARDKFQQQRQLRRAVIGALAKVHANDIARLLNMSAPLRASDTAKQIFLRWAESDSSQDDASFCSRSQDTLTVEKDHWDSCEAMIPVTIAMLAFWILREPLLPCMVVRWLANGDLRQTVTKIIYEKLRWSGSKSTGAAVITAMSLQYLPSSHQLRVAIARFLLAQPSEALWSPLRDARRAIVRPELMQRTAFSEHLQAPHGVDGEHVAQSDIVCQTLGRQIHGMCESARRDVACERERRKRGLDELVMAGTACDGGAALPKHAQNAVELCFARATYIANPDASFAVFIAALLDEHEAESVLAAQKQAPRPPGFELSAAARQEENAVAELRQRWLVAALRFRAIRLQARRLALYGSSVESGRHFRHAISRTLLDEKPTTEQTRKRYILSAVMLHEGLHPVHPVAKRMKSNVVPARGLRDVLSCTEYDTAADVISSLLSIGSARDKQIVWTSIRAKRQLGKVEAALEAPFLDPQAEQRISMSELFDATSTMVDVVHEQRIARPFSHSLEPFAKGLSESLRHIQARNEDQGLSALPELVSPDQVLRKAQSSDQQSSASRAELLGELCAAVVERVIHAAAGFGLRREADKKCRPTSHESHQDVDTSH